jgi:hypothetical protein
MGGDVVSVAPAEQGNDILGAIHDQGKHVGNVSSQNTHVKGMGIGNGCKLTFENHCIPSLALKTQLCLNNDNRCGTTDTF